MATQLDPHACQQLAKKSPGEIVGGLIVATLENGLSILCAMSGLCRPEVVTQVLSHPDVVQKYGDAAK